MTTAEIIALARFQDGGEPLPESFAPETSTESKAAPQAAEASNGRESISTETAAVGRGVAAELAGGARPPSMRSMLKAVGTAASDGATGPALGEWSGRPPSIAAMLQAVGAGHGISSADHADEIGEDRSDRPPSIRRMLRAVGATVAAADARKTAATRKSAPSGQKPAKRSTTDILAAARAEDAGSAAPPAKAKAAPSKTVAKAKTAVPKADLPDIDTMLNAFRTDGVVTESAAKRTTYNEIRSKRRGPQSWWARILGR